MKENKLRPLRGMFIMFVLINALFIIGQKRLVEKGFNTDVLIIGNLVLFAVSLTSFLLLHKSLTAANPNSFVRAMYMGFIIKFFVIALAAFIYIMIAKKEVSKPSLIVCAGLYILYTFIEVSVLTKLLKLKKNA
jgi:hypothetical protein